MTLALETVGLGKRFERLPVTRDLSLRIEIGARQQRLLEIAVAVATPPRVVLLDEPGAGIPEGERGSLPC